ncbi:ribonuclease E/G [Scopulibacillus cellulosilyticus]|uniref:Ribonuclease E/G n=1 Tax=Scopulibacillus cellulosilyticus TaxID=2665665 RepID=A0ABW2PUX8_9BACL
MAKLIIDSKQHPERAALVSDKEILAFYISRGDQFPVIGNIYIGSVTKVNNGLQGVFVDFGGDKHGFLHKHDILGFNDENSSQVPLSELVHHGDKVIVQVVKEQTERKGAKLTQYIQLSNAQMVYLPYSGYVAVSKKIPEDLKEKLRYQVSEWCSNQEGAIIRTEAKNYSLPELQKAFFELKDLWKDLLEKAGQSARRGVPLFTYHHFVNRVLNENIRLGIDEVIINKKLNESILNEINEKTNHKIPITFNSSANLFELYHIEGAFKKALKRKIYLNSGAFIVIDYTESMTAVDVNAGRFTGDNWEDTAFRVNMEAADEIVRQIRLRQIGGIIIIDFINMKNEHHQAALLDKLKSQFKYEKDTTQVLGYTKLGLMEISRKKSWYGLQEAVMDNLFKSN